MTNDFATKIAAIATWLSKFDDPDLTPYIHCSKINAVLLSLKQAREMIEKYHPAEPTPTRKQLGAISSIHSVLEQFEELFRQCRMETCVQFALSTAVSGPKYEITSLRDAAASAFKQLGVPEIAKLFDVNEQELAGQDMVDMKRVTQVLLQVAMKRRADAEDNLRRRFASLKAMGIDASQADVENISIPELPANLKLVVQHEDIAIGKSIGKGQSGMVNLGTVKATGEVVAVKILYRRALTAPELEAFRREIMTMSVLNHPTLIGFKGYTEEAPFYLITEYMANGSLFDTLRSRPDTLTPTIRSLIALDIARGLEYLHGKGVIHRDLKSLNILLDDKNRARICDFGMVRTKSEGPKTGMIGTAHWMAPEVLMSSPDYNEKVDVYSFAILLWELLTGNMPYKDLSQIKITMGVTNGTLRPPLPEKAPSKLKDLIQECWSQDPSVRPNMAKVVKRLSSSKYHFAGTDETEFAALAGTTGKHRSTKSQGEHKKRHRTRQKSSGVVIEQQDPVILISAIESNSGIEKIQCVVMLMAMMRKQETAEKVVAAGGCTTIKNILIDDSEGSDVVLNGLMECKSAVVFDVEVLKALLTYVNCTDDERREKAIKCLLVAADLRFEFLSSAPSFLVMLLGFFKTGMDGALVSKLIELTGRLIPTFHEIPEGIIPLLVLQWTKSQGQLKQSVTNCLVAALKFESAKNEMTHEIWKSLLMDADSAKPIMMQFAKGQEVTSCDKTFVMTAYELRRTCRGMIDLLAEYALSPRFAKHVMGLLPTGEDTRLIAPLYSPLFVNRDFYPTLVQIPEFYAVASYFVATGKIEMICAVLRKCEINGSIVVQSRLCELLVQAFTEAKGDTSLISIMAAIFSISSVVLAPEFTVLLPTLTDYVFNENKALRMPSFLCIAAMVVNGVSGVNFARLMPAAAFYVNSDSHITRNMAAVIIRDHLGTPGVNVNQCLRMFLDSYEVPDPVNTPIVIAAFKAVSISQQVESSLIAKLSALSK